MSIQEIDFTKTLNDEQVFETIMGNYSNFSKDWIIHQWNWMNNVYWAFKDHYKYMIIISLVEKTLQFFDQMQIDYSYDEYYSKSYLQIEKFSITELCEKLDENLIKKRFSLCWRWFYRMQIPLIIGYHKFMQDLSTFHIWGTICMNQVLNISKELNPVDKPPLDYFMTNNLLLNNLGSDAGISAMSISDMTQIPRATIIRKCKFLIKNDLIKMNEKKQYVLSTMNFKKILPYQTEAFRYKAKFIRKVLNLLVIS